MYDGELTALADLDGGRLAGVLARGALVQEGKDLRLVPFDGAAVEDLDVDAEAATAFAGSSAILVGRPGGGLTVFDIDTVKTVEVGGFEDRGRDPAGLQPE